ncbi:hypothetical protein AC579_9545 [Pseudocercospora musae]|uniref:Uncharacterized protein n=1 Tax=Pseudocercospora musae TaxID=113226 RepID=A0A139HDZ8_9PEZI|nr:hypothetical protein AC579_9545 [Pseudocercospora musae]
MSARRFFGNGKQAGECMVTRRAGGEEAVGSKASETRQVRTASQSRLAADPEYAMGCDGMGCERKVQTGESHTSSRYADDALREERRDGGVAIEPGVAQPDRAAPASACVGWPVASGGRRAGGWEISKEADGGIRRKTDVCQQQAPTMAETKKQFARSTTCIWGLRAAETVQHSIAQHGAAQLLLSSVRCQCPCPCPAQARDAPLPAGLTATIWLVWYGTVHAELSSEMHSDARQCRDGSGARFEYDTASPQAVYNAYLSLLGVSVRATAYVHRWHHGHGMQPAASPSVTCEVPLPPAPATPDTLSRSSSTQIRFDTQATRPHTSAGRLPMSKGCIMSVRRATATCSAEYQRVSSRPPRHPIPMSQQSPNLTSDVRLQQS